jgi:hypothetical protein
MMKDLNLLACSFTEFVKPMLHSNSYSDHHTHIWIVVLFSHQPQFEIISMFLQNQQPELSIYVRNVTLPHSQGNNADIMAEFW